MPLPERLVERERVTVRLDATKQRERPVRQEGAVLILDSDYGAARLLARTVRTLGHEARTYTHPDDLFADLPYESACCVVLETHSEGMKGLDVQNALRRLGHNLPVILCPGVPTFRIVSGR